MQDEKEYFKFRNSVILYPLVFVLLMWVVYWVEIRFGMDFTAWGVRPRTPLGLRGVAFSPFIHSGLEHLLHNTVPLMVLTTALFYFYHNIAWKTLLWLTVLSGLGTWLIGRPSYHIGMSGVIYALVAFLFFKGIVARHYRLIALSLLVVFLYGSLIWGTLPLDAKISWEGHLSGFVVGGLLAFVSFRESVPKPIKYNWEKPDYIEDDAFMRQFDENGNFFELPDETETEYSSEAHTSTYLEETTPNVVEENNSQKVWTGNVSQPTDDVKVTYTIKKGRSDLKKN